MRFHTFGNIDNRKMILVHGVLTPWQIWNDAIEHFSKNYFVIVPALDGHIEEEVSEYISVDDEAKKITSYVLDNYGEDIFAICGLSMGGAITYKIFESRRLNIQNVIMDGAPLLPLGKLPIWFMTKSYISIVHKSKKRDDKVIESFKKNFLPEKYLDSYLKFADTMSDNTIINMLNSVFRVAILESDNIDNSRIMFLHGTKGNEVVSAKAAKLMKEIYPQTVVKCFKGYAHAELAIYHSDEWIKTVDEFIS